ncbi:Protein-export protein SecB [uncultured Gammaproteobacteria bacterium]
MTDQPTVAGKANGQDTASQTSTQPIQVHVQYVKDLSFENPAAPQSLLAGQPAPRIEIGVNVQGGPIAEGVYEVVLQLRVEAKVEQTTVFLAEVAYCGVFSLPGIPPEHHRPVLMIEAPRLLFPFARAIVADVTRDGGYPPLLLTPIDFAELYRHQMAEATPAQA